MNFIRKTITAALMVALVSACGGGGGDDDSGSGGLSNNACSVIGLRPKIINGTQCVQETSSPVVRINIVNAARTSLGLCSGTMIAPTAVLTAAHCFEEPSSFIGVEVGNATIPAESVKVHPNFREEDVSFGLDADVNDVAIVHLTTSPGLPTLPLATTPALNAGDVLQIFGYGLDEDGNVDVLKSGETEVTDLSSDLILSIFEGDGSNTCQGDSGGPALLVSNGRTGVAGITSSGSVAGCQTGDRSLYTNVQNPGIINFIRSEVPGVATF